MKIITYEEKEMIPLTKIENKSYKKQEKYHICEEKFCMDTPFLLHNNCYKRCIVVRESL